MSYFITGTDTEVGKTVVSSALLYALGQQGQTAAGFKPVAAGCEADGQQLDVQQLLQYSTPALGLTASQINPYCFIDPIAPHLAAQQQQTPIDVSVIRAAFEQLQRQADRVIVEGAGGCRVPLNDQQDMLDLMVQLQLPVIVVVAMRLGCLNHALLTVDNIQQRQLPLAGWVANSVSPSEMPWLSDNIDTLQRRIDAPLLGHIPFLPSHSGEQAAAYLQLSLLQDSLPS